MTDARQITPKTEIKIGPLTINIVDQAKSAIAAEYTPPSPSEQEAFKRLTQRHTAKTLITDHDNAITAYRLEFNKSENIKAKKAIVYIAGGRHNVVSCLPQMESVMRQLGYRAESDGIYIACYMQDYRGRETNKQGGLEFSDYTVQEHVADQAKLIKHLVAEGYAPEDICIVGHSYGASFALWVYKMLCDENAARYSAIKVFADRGIARLLETKAIKMVLSAETLKQAREILSVHQMLPAQEFDELVVEVPRIILQSVKGDDVFDKNNTLVAYHKKNEKLQGCIHEVEALGDNAHHELLDKLIHNQLPFLSSSHLLQAFVLGKSIKLVPEYFDSARCLQLLPTRYTLKKNGDADDKAVYVTLPSYVAGLSKSYDDSIAVGYFDNQLFALVHRLHDYCMEREGEASNFGPHYNKAKFSAGYALSAKVEKAVEIMRYLAEAPRPNFDALNKIAREKKGPHTEGSLKAIVDEVIKFVNGYELALADHQKKHAQYLEELNVINKAIVVSKRNLTASSSTLFGGAAVSVATSSDQSPYDSRVSLIK